MKTKLEIIEETVAYYSEDVSRRAIDSEGCKYLTEDGRMCALGRCLASFDQEYEGAVAEEIIEQESTVFKDEYKGHEVGFWIKLQVLHDNDSNWTAEGLSEEGKYYVEKLKKDWRN